MIERIERRPDREVKRQIPGPEKKNRQDVHGIIGQLAVVKHKIIDTPILSSILSGIGFLHVYLFADKYRFTKTISRVSKIILSKTRLCVYVAFSMRRSSGLETADMSFATSYSQ